MIPGSGETPKTRYTPENEISMNFGNTYPLPLICYRGNKSIYLYRSGPLLENGLDRPDSRYDRCGFAKFFFIFNPSYPYLPWGWIEPESPSEDFLSCALDGHRLIVDGSHLHVLVECPYFLWPSPFAT